MFILVKNNWVSFKLPREGLGSTMLFFIGIVYTTVAITKRRFFITAASRARLTHCNTLAFGNLLFPAGISRPVSLLCSRVISLSLSMWHVQLIFSSPISTDSSQSLLLRFRLDASRIFILIQSLISFIRICKIFEPPSFQFCSLIHICAAYFATFVDDLIDDNW